MKIQEAIFKAYSNVVTVVGYDAFDAEGNVVKYDISIVEAKFAEMQAAEESAKQAQIDAKQTALNKLMALGLTEEEALALGK